MYMTRALESSTYNEHGHEKVLLGDLSVREDVVEDGIHVALVLFPKGKDTLIVMTYGQNIK